MVTVKLALPLCLRSKCIEVRPGSFRKLVFHHKLNRPQLHTFDRHEGRKILARTTPLELEHRSCKLGNAGNCMDPQGRRHLGCCYSLLAPPAPPLGTDIGCSQDPDILALNHMSRGNQSHTESYPHCTAHRKWHWSSHILEGRPCPGSSGTGRSRRGRRSNPKGTGIFHRTLIRMNRRSP